MTRTEATGATGTASRTGTRWRRVAVMNLCAFSVLGWMVSQLWTGTVMGLGAGLVIQGQKSQFSSARLSTTNVAFGVMPITLRSGSGDSTRYVLRMGFANGTLDGFCVSQTESFLGVDYTIRITSGGNDINVTDVSGKNVQLDATTVTSTNLPNTNGNGVALRGNVELGVAVQSVTTWQAGGVDVVNPLDGPESYSGINGRLFSVDSDVGDLYNIKGDLYDAVIEGPVNLKKLKIEVVPGGAAAQGCKNLPIKY